MQIQGDKPVVDVRVDEFILALRLDHVVALFTEAPHDSKDAQFRYWSKRIARYLNNWLAKNFE